MSIAFAGHIRRSILLLLLALWPTIVSASVDSTSIVEDKGVDIADTLWSDITGMVDDAGLIFTAPLRFDRNGWLMTGGLLAGTGAIMLLDDDLRDMIARGHDPTRDEISAVGNRGGTLLPAGIIIGGLYFGGLAFDEPGVRMAGRNAGEALLFAGVVNGLIKVLAGRHRPFLNDGPYAYRGPSRDDAYQSLPSGHTTIAFAVAASLAADIDNPWATAGLYGLATVTALSRMYDDRHWGSDVFLAAGLSAAIGYGVVHLRDIPDDLQGSFYLVPGPGSLTAGWRF